MSDNKVSPDDIIAKAEIARKAIYDLEQLLGTETMDGPTKHPSWYVVFNARVMINGIEHKALVEKGVRSE